ncbi:unnamed protein product [Peniophora sp. CBMAI 1063]|nr:unnamed protein product [Peniophora sp. CBMAI 1063]
MPIAGLDIEREELADEVAVLQSIYGDEAIQSWTPATEHEHAAYGAKEGVVRYQVNLSLSPPHQDVSLRILVSLPPTYPSSSPPQLQLLSRYIGAFGVDAELFGAVLKTYISIAGVEFAPDVVCVFDGLSNVLERVERWYEDKLSAKAVGELLRDSGRADDPNPNQRAPVLPAPQLDRLPAALPPGLQLIEAEPIVDRKSAFVGRACRITDPAQVPAVLGYLMADKRIARAAHPIINAWRCQVGSVLHQDNDDDGETAAGGRLAHLLQLLDIKNVLVIVTRYYGGILLGPDRFKHINQAARDALVLGGFLDEKKPDTKERASFHAAAPSESQTGTLRPRTVPFAAVLASPIIAMVI